MQIIFFQASNTGRCAINDTSDWAEKVRFTIYPMLEDTLLVLEPLPFPVLG
jgi:hypothetical protein